MVDSPCTDHQLLPFVLLTLASVASPQIPRQSDFPLRKFPKSLLLLDSTTLIALLSWIFSPGCVATISASSTQDCRGPSGNSIFLSRAKQSSFVLKIGTFLQIHSWEGWVSALMRVGILKKGLSTHFPTSQCNSKRKGKRVGMVCPIEGGIWGTDIEMHEATWVQNYKLKIPFCNETGTK